MLKKEELLLQFFVASTYAGLAHLTHLFYAYNSITSLFWPSAGVAMAAVLMGGPRFLWGVAGGAAAINFYAAPTYVSALGITFGNIAEPAIVSALVHYTGRSMTGRELPSFENYHALLLYGACAGVISALSGPLTLYYDGIFAADNVSINIMYWWMGDALGIMLMVPFILGIPKWATKSWKEWTDIIALLTLAVLMGLVIFNDISGVESDATHTWASLAEDYWLFLIGIAIAGRHGCVGSSFFLIVVAVQALIGVVSHKGYFAPEPNHVHLLSYWGFMTVLSVVTTSIAIYIEREKVAKNTAKLYNMVFDSQEGMIITDSKMSILKVNDAWSAITGYTEDEVVGKTPRVLASGRHDRDFYKNMWHQINTQGRWSGEIINKRKTGEEYPEWLTISAVKNDNGEITNYVGQLTDLTEEKQRQEELTRLSFYDYLTELPNRRLLMDRLSHEITSNVRSGKHGALMFLDLDHFKNLNDTMGHDVGDALLKQVAVRISEQLRREDTVARLGGDEFVVMLRDLSGDEKVAGRQARTIAEKILDAVALPYLLKDVVYHCSVSVGVTLFNGEGFSVEELLKRADLAMYKVKDAGRNGISFFDINMQDTMNKRAEIENGLRVALDEKQFELFYQPQIVCDFGDTIVIGAEALIRWRKADGSYVSPADFIPVAEDSGQILAIGNWVMHTAIQQLAQWHDTPGLEHLTLAVNVSGRQFYQHDFVEDVIMAVSSNGVDPTKLKLEITESVALENISETIAKIDQLKTFGIKFSMDDFGTGQSSLSSLKKLPIDQLKIDQSFVRDITLDHDDAVMVQTIIALAHNLGLEVIAEGVETIQQKEFLFSNNCKQYQGYYFSKPLNTHDFAGYIPR